MTNSNPSEEEIPDGLKIVQRQGDITKHKPKRIITSKQHLTDKTDLLCQVEWIQSSSNEILEPTWISNSILKQHCPMLLIEYYESKMILPKSKK